MGTTESEKMTREEAEALESSLYRSMELEGQAEGLTPEIRERVIQRLMRGVL